ncbi:MAG TPA: DUF6519 domain-containing protein [Longimicrobium sp.]
MDEREPWTADPPGGGDPPRVFVDYFDHRTGAGSLVATGAQRVTRALERPLDLRGVRDLVFAARGAFGVGEAVFFLGSGGAREALPTAEGTDLDGWRTFRADPSALPGGFDLGAVDEYGVEGMDPAQRYAFDFLKADLPVVHTLVPTVPLGAFQALPQNPGDPARLALDDDHRFWGGPTLEATRSGAVEHAFPAVRDLRPMRRLLVAARTGTGAVPVYDLALVDDTAGPGAEVDLVPTSTVTAGAWQVRAYDVPQAGIDWSRVRTLRWEGLDPGVLYRLGPVLAEMGRAGNLVIMGGDGTSAGAGRFYGGGLAAVKERHETYFSQRDLPEADATVVQPPAEGRCRRDLAYLDLWERPVTWLEDPDIREVALEGPDTTTRTQLVAQVRILVGDEVNAGDPAPLPHDEFAALPRRGGGTLTTKDTPAAVLDPCADPCEPPVAGPFLGEENRLFRVQVHEAGDIGLAGDPGTARLKWSRENGATATAVTAPAAAGGVAVEVERPELFSIGDLVEVADDLADLGTGPFSDRRATRGELRRVTGIDLQNRVLSWEDAAPPEPDLAAGLDRAYSPAYHPKVRRWDGLVAATPGDLVLADGVVVEVGGADLLPGDYWVFTTRVADRSVQRLVEAPARGVEHRYYPLAAVGRCTAGGQETVSVQDLRRPFRPLTELRAADVAFDPGACLERHEEWADVGNVQEAIDALCRFDLGEDLRKHNRYLHGHGVVCGLQVRCDMENRRQVTVRPGYALDCDGYGIDIPQPRSVELVQMATLKDLLTAGDGDVCITLQRGVLGDATFDVEAHRPRPFWDEVLEGTLLLDFYRDCIEDLVDFVKDRFLPLPDLTVPPSDKQKLTTAVLNLAVELLNPGSGRYVFLSRDEHDRLKQLYDDLRAELQSGSFCAMFDNVTPFPEYPFPGPAITTAYGLFRMHTRLRLHPTRPLAYTCGAGNVIHVYDLQAGEVREALVFPGGTNVEVQDVAVSADGTRLHAVGLLDGKDSVFATAAVPTALPGHAWGPTAVICDFKFVTLGVRPGDGTGRLYCIARAQGLYRFDPDNLPLSPTVADQVGAPFNATGLFSFTPDGGRAVAAANVPLGLGIETNVFNTLWSFNLTAGGVVLSALGGEGTEEEDDLAARDAGSAWVTCRVPNSAGPKRLLSIDLATSAVEVTIDLGTDDLVRIAPLPDGDVMVMDAETYRVHRADVPTATLDTAARVPVQVVPGDLAVSADGETMVVLNYLSNTLSVVDVGDAVLMAGGQPDYTIEPPVALSAYRQQMLAAYADLLKGLLQYVKDCFCDRFLVDCPACGPDDKVYLCCVEVRGEEVYHICNFTKRHYVKSFRTYGYWLSTVPVLPLFKKLFGKLCCTVLMP